MIMDDFSAFVNLSKKNEFDGQWIVMIKARVVASGSAKIIKEKLISIRKEYPHDTPFLAKVSSKTFQIV